MCSPSRIGALSDHFVARGSWHVLLIACGLLGCLTSFQAPAQTPSPTPTPTPTPTGAYPNRAVRIVIPLGPGNSAEIVTRLVAQKLSTILPQVVNHLTPNGQLPQAAPQQ